MRVRSLAHRINVLLGVGSVVRVGVDGMPGPIPLPVVGSSLRLLHSLRVLHHFGPEWHRLSPLLRIWLANTVRRAATTAARCRVAWVLIDSLHACLAIDLGCRSRALAAHLDLEAEGTP